ncbi:MAG: hypothetical protein AAGC64_00065 [Bacteroidota bacterium]
MVSKVRGEITKVNLDEKTVIARFGSIEILLENLNPAATVNLGDSLWIKSGTYVGDGFQYLIFTENMFLAYHNSKNEIEEGIIRIGAIEETLTVDIPLYEQMEVIIDPGTATSQQIGEFLGELSILYEMMGGSGISFKSDGIKVVINS